MRKVPLFKPYHEDAMEIAAASVLRSGAIASGHYVQEFASQFGQLVGTENVTTTNDMSSAIQIALRLAGVGPGDAVLSAPFSCMSTNGPIATAGAIPAWVDIDPKTGSMDPEKLESALVPNAKALILYHVSGYPADVQTISEFCRRKGLALIEDCDNALLSTIEDRQVGTFGDYSIYSYYPNRQINASEGGALTCKTSSDATRATKLRRYGIDIPRFRSADGEIDPECDIPEIGWAATLNNLCSAVGLVQIPTVKKRVAASRANAAWLDEVFSEISGLEPIRPLPGAAPSYWTYLVLADRRDELMAHLKARGIGASKIHHPVNQYSGFGARSSRLSGVDEFFKQVLALPCGWWLEIADLQYIKTSILEFC